MVAEASAGSSARLLVKRLVRPGGLWPLTGHMRLRGPSLADSVGRACLSDRDRSP